MKIGLILLIFPLFIFGQEKKNFQATLLGPKFQLANFARPKPFDRSTNLNSGIGISLIKGLNSHFDWQITVGGIFTDSASDKKINSKKLLLQTDFALRVKLFASQSAVNPFLLTGAGAQTYNGLFGLYIPAGLGIQLPLFKDAYFIMDAQYRVSLPSKINNHFCFGIGIFGLLNKNRKQTMVVIPTYPSTAPTIYSDRDKDGIVDSLDHCPDEPGMAMFHGCPDSDGDGIQNSEDKCPFVFGYKRYGGCPIPDTDKDGIDDENDSCVTVFGYKKYNGCPIPDTDNDGVNDEEDSCVSLFGVKENKGCPIKPREVLADINKLTRNILFESGKATLLRSSFASLDTIAKILKQNPGIRLSVEGHTDNTNTPEFNQRLSEERARAVIKYLILKGVSSKRLHGIGFGQVKPIAENGTKEGRAKNRRVEFRLIE